MITTNISLVLAAIACLLAGLMLGVSAIFRIAASRGRLRGYGHAILAVLFSIVTLLGGLVLAFMVGTPGSSRSGPGFGESRRWSESDGYRSLVATPPPNWFHGERSLQTIQGPAKVGPGNVPPEDAAELERIIRHTGFQGFEARRVMELTIRNLRDRATNAPIVIWYAMLDTNLEPTESSYSRSGSDRVLQKWGRILIGIYTEDPLKGVECVHRLARHYDQRLAAITIK